MLKDLSAAHVYHGSYMIVDTPDLDKCRSGKDFGKGFYLTTDKDQAIRFAKIVAKRYGTQSGFVNEYTLSDFVHLKVFEFESTDRDWLDCIIGNRISEYKELAGPWRKYDVICGKIADDDTSQTINAYMAGAYGEIGSESAVNFAVSMFRPEKLKNQICIKTAKAIQRISFVSAQEVPVK